MQKDNGITRLNKILSYQLTGNCIRSIPEQAPRVPALKLSMNRTVWFYCVSAPHLARNSDNTPLRGQYSLHLWPIQLISLLHTGFGWNHLLVSWQYPILRVLHVSRNTDLLPHWRMKRIRNDVYRGGAELRLISSLKECSWLLRERVGL